MAIGRRSVKKSAKSGKKTGNLAKGKQARAVSTSASSKKSNFKKRGSQSSTGSQIFARQDSTVVDKANEAKFSKTTNKANFGSASQRAKNQTPSKSQLAGGGRGSASQFSGKGKDMNSQHYRMGR